MAATASVHIRKGPAGTLPPGGFRRHAAIHFREEPAQADPKRIADRVGTEPVRARVAVRFVVFELLVWVSLYGLYLAVRGLSIASTDEALANARAVVNLERAVGLFHEAGVQGSLESLEEVLSGYYLLGFAPLLAGVLGWLAVRHRHVYRELRTLLLISIALAIIVHVALPVAPPRLVPGLGIADTVGLDRDGSSFAGVPYNPYAAMPSMHVGWSLLVGLFAIQAADSLLVRLFFAAHPAVMAVAVTATGNHYFLDSVAGAAIALAALGLWRFVPVARSHLAAGPQPACAHC